MSAPQQQRFRLLVARLQAQLRDMAIDARLYAGIAASEGRPPSSASTPSLRARESEVIMPVSRSATPDVGGGNVKVVVRVRGFLPREIDRGAGCLVEMNPTTQATKLLIPDNNDPANAKSQSRKIFEEKNFTFDNSFWSHDPNDEHYAQQEDIYNALGEEFLDHNFEGYHTCIFAYGQTGSGKSYTMMGTSEAPGLIPRTCEDLFQRLEANASPNVSYTSRVSYFEVYNEHVRDLLSSHQSRPGGHPNYLKIREHPVEGPYIKDLTDAPVKNYQEILHYMRLGDASRTTASTKMNDTSSRSHAVFTIVLKQIHHDIASDSTTERVARIRLVDLAGSERAKATEATGARLREGSNINKSLTTLGRVIAALADPRHQRSKSRKEVVPYRDSILTWLLKDSLGGNSKTAMIACISPSDYDETLSTLRYADQAKRIRTRAVVNQDSVSAAQRDAQMLEMQNTIRELQLQVNLANQQASANKVRAEIGVGKDEKLEEYQMKVERMQRLMEEERLVGESKIRQLMEQNDALRLHLKLAVESLKNPIPEVAVPFERSVRRSVSGVSGISVANSLGVREKVGEGNKENVVLEEVKKREESEPERKSLAEEVVDEYEDEGYEEGGFDADSHTMEVQAHLEELLSDIGLFKKKIADDHSRFGIRGFDGGPYPGLSRTPLGESNANR